jgi:hypothetical protein
VPRRSGPPPFADLRAFAEWWADVGRVTPCCQISTLEMEAGDEAQFDCGRCELAGKAAALDDENRRAWGVFGQCATRFCTDTGAGAVLLDRVTQDDDDETAMALFSRLSVLYDVLRPRRNVDGA